MDVTQFLEIFVTIPLANLKPTAVFSTIKCKFLVVDS